MIKPCPFHNWEEELYVQDKEHMHPTVEEQEYRNDEGDVCSTFFVGCPYCGCRGPHTSNEEDAVDYWNDRN